MTTDVVGRDPTLSELLLGEEEKRLGPGASLERLETHAKYLFSIVAIVGTLIAGFGLVKTDHAGVWVAVPVSLVSISLACAIVAITPKHHVVEGDSLTKLQEHYRELLRTRGLLIRAAGIAFAAALLTTPFAFWLGMRDVPTITGAAVLKVTRSAAGDTLDERVELTNIPEGCSVRSSSALVTPTGSKTTTTHFQRASGATVKFEIDRPIEPARQVVVTTEVLRRGAVIFSDVTSVNIPQRGTP
jgi:hypothetical protein